MFEKKQFIFSETLGVCKVMDIVKLSSKKGADDAVDYYHLKSLFDKNKDAYIPVENHQVVLRELIGFEDAAKLTEEERKKLSKIRQEEIEYVLNQQSTLKA